MLTRKLERIPVEFTPWPFAFNWEESVQKLHVTRSANQISVSLSLGCINERVEFEQTTERTTGGHSTIIEEKDHEDVRKSTNSLTLRHDDSCFGVCRSLDEFVGGCQDIRLRRADVC